MEGKGVKHENLEGSCDGGIGCGSRHGNAGGRPGNPQADDSGDRRAAACAGLSGRQGSQGKKIADEGAALATQLQTQGPTLTDAKRVELQKQIEDKDIEFRHFKEDASQQLEDAKKKELQKLEQQIMPIIVEVGKEMKLELVFNKFQSGLVYADDKLDITDLVLRRFNTKVTK